MCIADKVLSRLLGVLSGENIRHLNQSCWQGSDSNRGLRVLAETPVAVRYRMKKSTLPEVYRVGSPSTPNSYVTVTSMAVSRPLTIAGS